MLFYSRLFALIRGQFLIQNVHEFGDDAITRFLRIKIPSLEFRIQRLEANAVVSPGAVGLAALFAVVALHGVAIVQAAAQRLDQNQASLARTGYAGAENAQTAVRDTRLHGSALDSGDEHPLVQPH